MEFEAIIGLELHIQMKTKSKLFSSAPVSFGKEPNTHVDIIDMGFPGVMPTVNKQAVVNAIRLSNALHMHIDNTLIFERKNYYYSDLPRGYQITQQFRPLGTNGYLAINNRKIDIERLHIEEDTCKQIHLNDMTLLDYNRSDIPLVEIVTKPVIHNGKEAALFVEKIRSIVSFLGVSDGKMERGSIRCDVNISITEKNSNKFGTKVEIKNLNSITNIEKAIDFEISRQSALLSDGKSIKQETRRFDESKKQTVLMRVKTDDIDYRYFTEPNIVPIKLSKEFIQDAIKSSPELAEEKKNRYLSLGVSEYHCSLLIADINVANYFDEGIKCGANPVLLANWLIDNIQSVLNKQEIEITEFIISPKLITELLCLVDKKEISNKQAKELFAKMLSNPRSPLELLKENDISLLNDIDVLKAVVLDVVESNPKSVIDYKNGKDKALGYLVGQVISKTQGKANPALAKELIVVELKRR